MKRNSLVLSILFVALSAFASAQNLITFVADQGVWAVTNGKQIIQYDIGFIPGAWLADQESDTYQFTQIPEMLQIITVKGVSKLYIETSQTHWCADVCSFKATFVGPINQQTVTLQDGSFLTIVTGELIGTFKLGSTTTQNVEGFLYFATDPATSEIPGNAPGELIIELAPVEP